MFDAVKTLFNGRRLVNMPEAAAYLTEIDQETRNKLQELLLLMYRDLFEVCRRHQIKPFLVGGSLLGAVRHKGFIPWDDDLDVGMFREDYDRFCAIFETDLSGKYVLDAPNYSRRSKARFAKMMKKDTTFKEVMDETSSDFRGVFIDIFVMENMPESPMTRAVRGTLCMAMEFISGQVFLWENRTPLLKNVYCANGKAGWYVRMLVGRMFSFYSSSKWFAAIDRLVNYPVKTGLYGFPTGRRHYFGDIYKEDDLLPLGSGSFCGMEVPVFRNWDCYLQRNYGDYMTLIPEGKRERHFVLEIRL